MTALVPLGTGALATSIIQLVPKRSSPVVFGLLLFFSIGIMSQAAHGEFTPKDGQVLGRTLGFVGDGMTGVAVVGVVVAPAVPASEHYAESIRAVIGDDLLTGRVRLQARMIAVEQLTGVTGIAALYVTPGLAGSMDMISSAAQRLHVPTISASLACVQTGGCVIGYSSEPTVQILIDSAAAERTGVHFMQAFRMLVREK